MTGIEAAFLAFIASDPDPLRTSASGTAWMGFNCGVHDGNAVTWLRVTIFGENAQTMAPRLHKGSKIYAEGKLTQEEWTNKDGVARHGLKLAASRIELLFEIGRRKPRKAKGNARPVPTRSQSTSRPELDDQVPF